MQAKIQKWGNSQGLRLSKNMLKDIQLEVGDEVDIAVVDSTIVIAPLKNIRGKYRLKDLVAKMPKDSKTGEIDWGKPAGKEVW